MKALAFFLNSTRLRGVRINGRALTVTMIPTGQKTNSCRGIQIKLAEASIRYLFQHDRGQSKPLVLHLIILISGTLLGNEYFDLPRLR